MSWPAARSPTRDRRRSCSRTTASCRPTWASDPGPRRAGLPGRLTAPGDPATQALHRPTDRPAEPALGRGLVTRAADGIPRQQPGQRGGETLCPGRLEVIGGGVIEVAHRRAAVAQRRDDPFGAVDIL